MSGVEVVRGGVVESVHPVHVAVARPDGTVVAWLGAPEMLTFYRSAAKPFQALPLVEEGIADRFGLTPEELALCCGSHEGEPEHVGGVRSILAKVGVAEDLLRCGAHPPYRREEADRLTRRGEPPLRIHNNCSGKHAGMIALARGMGWSPDDYHEATHPVQRRMLREVLRWTGLSEARVPTAVDGCGVVCFAAPLRIMARSFAAFTRAADRREEPARVVQAMTGHPFMVGGSGRTCTEVMKVAGDRVWVKLGAEGVYGGGCVDRGLGFAMKVADGGRRAVEVALIRTLQDLEVLTPDEVEGLRHHGNPAVRNTRGTVVGEIRPTFRLSVPATRTA